MYEERIRFLERLLGTICPSGYEEEASRVWRDEAATFADRSWGDQHGNSIAVVNEGGRPRVMLAGHIDEIGLMITHIDESGFLSFSGIGTWDAQVLPGQRVRIRTSSGVEIGMIGRKPVHLLDADDQKKVVKIDDLWIDIGAKDRNEAAAVVAIGDPAVLDYGFVRLRNGLVSSRGLDDRMGAYVVLEAARLLAAESPKAAIYAVATVQEEIGYRGAVTSAFTIQPDIGFAVDVAHATDIPGMEKECKRIGEIQIGAGPVIARGAYVNPALFRRVLETAKVRGIPFQVQGCPGNTGTDTDVIQLSHSGVATSLVSVANRYMHSPCEIVHLEDLQNAARLISATVAGLDEHAKFTSAEPGSPRLA